MQFSRSVVLMVLLSSATAAAHADNIYNVNLTSGRASVVGTITTDGTLGTLQGSNILGSSLTFSDGTNTSTITNNAYFVMGNDLSATSMGLFYDFADSSTMNYAGFASNNFDTFLCFTGSGSCPGGTGSGTAIHILNTQYATTQTGLQQIAGTSLAQTPEPSSLALLGTGLLGVYGAARRRFV